MVKKIVQILIFTCVVVIGASCAPSSSDTENARQALIDYFRALSLREYPRAAQLFGGSYEILAEYNPDVAPDNHAALWQRGCEQNGLQCLTIRTTTFQELTTSGEYIFLAEFNSSDGSQFKIEACCGENPVPAQYQFPYRIEKGNDGQFRVLDMPIYVP